MRNKPIGTTSPQRALGISGKGYKASYPINALLNYAYAILAGQVERAAQLAE